LLVLTLALVLAGCTATPTYERPTVDMPAKFKEASLSPAEAGRWKAAQPADDLARGRWWAIFADPVLDSLQAQALAANQDLKAAAARVKAARAVHERAGAERYPQMDAGVGPMRQRASNASQGLGADAPNGAATL